MAGFFTSESTGRATENIDDILRENMEATMKERGERFGTIERNPAYDEEGNLIVSAGYPPDIAMGPFATGKGLLGALKRVKGLFSKKNVDLYRGVPNWYRGEMVKGGRFVGGGEATKEAQNAIYTGLKNKSLWTTTSPGAAKMYSLRSDRSGPGYILKFSVPEKYIKKHAISGDKSSLMNLKTKVFEEGLPKKYFKELQKIKWSK